MLVFFIWYIIILLFFLYIIIITIYVLQYRYHSFLPSMYHRTDLILFIIRNSVKGIRQLMFSNGKQILVIKARDIKNLLTAGLRCQHQNFTALRRRS